MRSVDDFLARRTRALILNAKASTEMAPIVAELMMKELDKNKKWKTDQIDSFNKLAGKYILEVS